MSNISLTNSFSTAASVDVAAVLRSAGQAFQFRRGHTVFSEGEPGNRLYIVDSGKVKIGTSRAPGRDVLLRLLGPNEIFGDLSLFDPGPRSATATTVTEVRATGIDRNALRHIISYRVDVADALLRLLARRERLAVKAATDLAFNDVPGRLAKTLLQLAQRFGTREPGGMRVIHDLTQLELAQLVGASRETINKALSVFARRGWLQLDSKSVLILEPDHLARRAHRHIVR
ncbi:Crp/Fnr family transcriptional regulator [Amycolatopsis magusensis]|uniref:Crp/Fnr family transcriptional regulator n=1 Tax=Amycolatopsis magusensis TaxID=882444 RepID=UPI0037B3ECAE